MTPAWIGFIAGLFIGAHFGMGFMSLLIIAKESDERMEEITKRSKQ